VSACKAAVGTAAAGAIGAAAVGAVLSGTTSAKDKAGGEATIGWRALVGCEIKVNGTGSSTSGSWRLSWLGCCCGCRAAAAGDSAGGTAGSERGAPAWEEGTAGRKVSLGKETGGREKAAGFGSTWSSLSGCGMTADCSTRSANEGTVVRGTASKEGDTAWGTATRGSALLKTVTCGAVSWGGAARGTASRETASGGTAA
jgi:hypothetical protein